MTFDDDLRRALRRREPPVGFAARTLDRVRGGIGPLHNDRLTRDSRSPSVRAWMAGAVAASLLIAGAATEFRLRQRDAIARRAAGDLTLALRITSEKLNDVQDKLRTTGQSVEIRHDNQRSR
jgi:hypothetical protein